MDKILSFIGLMRRAGALAIGAEVSYDAARTGKTHLLVMASDAAKNTVSAARNAQGEGNHVDIVFLPFTKTQLGEALGRSDCAVIAICHARFAAALKKKLALIETDNGTSKEKGVDSL